MPFPCKWPMQDSCNNTMTWPSACQADCLEHKAAHVVQQYVDGLHVACCTWALTISFLVVARTACPGCSLQSCLHQPPLAVTPFGLASRCGTSRRGAPPVSAKLTATRCWNMGLLCTLKAHPPSAPCGVGPSSSCKPLGVASSLPTSRPSFSNCAHRRPARQRALGSSTRQGPTRH